MQFTFYFIFFVLLLQNNTVLPLTRRPVQPGSRGMNEGNGYVNPMQEGKLKCSAYQVKNMYLNRRQEEKAIKIK